MGSSISYSSIAEDIAVSPNIVKKYISILEALYVVFQVVPFSNNIAKNLLKEPKIYFFDKWYKNHRVGAGLTYFHEKYELPACQVVKELKQGIEIVEGSKYLQELYL